jgi:hypothetical protein
MAVCDDGQHVTDGPMKGIAYVLRTVVFVGECEKVVFCIL